MSVQYNTKQSLHAIIVAAGQGTRLGGAIPKQYADLGGKPVLWHSYNVFLETGLFETIRFVIHPAHEVLFRAAFKDNICPDYIAGGALRQDSVLKGLLSLPSHATHVVIHDAARPFITEMLVRDIVSIWKNKETACVSASIPVIDTLRSGHDTLDRSKIMAIQTPQGFPVKALLGAFEKTDDKEYTDETALMLSQGYTIDYVSGDRRNFKITQPDDLMIARRMIEHETITKVGLGFDVHAFADKPAQTVRLGGIDIPHHLGLAGHSDADVVLHAVTDAILGSIAEGDIGTHFPPSDLKWKDKDSAFFLEKAFKLLNDRSGNLMHVDITVLCEKPAIGPHRQAMQKRIADLLHLGPQDVAVKATTTERLGFLGREEGIAAQACVTVRLPRQ